MISKIGRIWNYLKIHSIYVLVWERRQKLKLFGILVVVSVKNLLYWEWQHRFPLWHGLKHTELTQIMWPYKLKMKDWSESVEILLVGDDPVYLYFLNEIINCNSKWYVSINSGAAKHEINHFWLPKEREEESVLFLTFRSLSFTFACLTMSMLIAVYYSSILQQFHCCPWMYSSFCSAASHLLQGFSY